VHQQIVTYEGNLPRSRDVQGEHEDVLALARGYTYIHLCDYYIFHASLTLGPSVYNQVHPVRLVAWQLADLLL